MILYHYIHVRSFRAKVLEAYKSHIIELHFMLKGNKRLPKDHKWSFSAIEAFWSMLNGYELLSKCHKCKLH